MSFKKFITESDDLQESATGRVAPGQWASSISHGKSSIEIERMIRDKRKVLQSKGLSDADRKWHQQGIHHLGVISTRMREQGKPTNEDVELEEAWKRGDQGTINDPSSSLHGQKVTFLRNSPTMSEFVHVKMNDESYAKQGMGTRRKAGEATIKAANLQKEGVDEAVVTEVSKEKLTKYVHNAAMDQLSDKSTVSMKKTDAENDAALKRSAKRTAGVTQAVKKITNEGLKDFVKTKKDSLKSKVKDQVDVIKFAAKNSDQ